MQVVFASCATLNLAKKVAWRLKVSMRRSIGVWLTRSREQDDLYGSFVVRHELEEDAIPPVPISDQERNPE